MVPLELAGRIGTARTRRTNWYRKNCYHHRVPGRGGRQSPHPPRDATPKIPLITNRQYSYEVYDINRSAVIRSTITKPKNPIIFFRKLIWRLFRILPESSNNITPEDQHSAARIAYISPEFRFKFIILNN